MNKKIKITIWIILILFLAYMAACSGFDVIWQNYFGGDILYFNRDLPITEEYSALAAKIPNILLFIYVILSSIIFIRTGYIDLKK